MLELMKIHYVTSNTGKFDEARAIFQKLAGFEIVHTPLHLEEIQGNSRDIALHKIKQAHSILKAACLIDDISLHCAAIGGLPGPYVRSFLEAIGDTGIATLISHYKDSSCKVVCNIAYATDDGSCMLFEGILHGSIVSPRGTRLTHATSWNAIVQPSGLDRTFAEMTLEESSTLSARYIALNKFRNHLLQT